MAEGVFRHLSKMLPSSSRAPKSSDQWIIDSAGTGAYHALSPPDPRTLAVLKKHGITDYDHSARKIRNQDFHDFDYIFAMDAENLEDLIEMRDRLARSANKSSTSTKPRLAEVALFGVYGGRSEDEEVDDPYYGGNDGFDRAFEQVSRFSKGFLESLQKSA